MTTGLKRIHKLGVLVDTCTSRRRVDSAIKGAASSSRPGIGWIDVCSAVIRYRVQGAGPHTIVFAADPPIVIEHYDELYRLLGNEFRVIVLEMPGFGFSIPRAELQFGFTETNDLIARALRELVGGPCLLAFPCVSAYCAIDIAARHPDLVRGLVVIQAPSWPEQLRWRHARDSSGVLMKPVIGQLMLRILRRRIPAMWFSAAVGHRERLQNLVETADVALANGACFCLASVFQRYMSDEVPPLGPVRCPSLIVWGEADRSHRRTDKQSTLRLLPDAELVRFSEAGHFPELEEPTRFAGLVRDWHLRQFAVPDTQLVSDS
jgi:pimeloyl-ACP methyl ester carboxylesterase